MITMDAKNEKILEHLIGAGILSKGDQEIVRAAADAAAEGNPSTNIELYCNRNYCLVVAS